MPPIDYRPLWEDPGHNLAQLVLPALATGYCSLAVMARMTRSALLEAVIRRRHALKNAFSTGSNPHRD